VPKFPTIRTRSLLDEDFGPRGVRIVRPGEAMSSRRHASKECCRR
jgi:hypothetical protein